MKTVYKKILFVCFLLFFFIAANNKMYSQSGEKFPFGVYAHEHWYENYQQIKDMGANTIVQYAADGSDTTYNLNYLTDFDKVIALNFRRNDYIHYYSEGYYKKWQAEEDIGDLKSGIKHSFGKDTTIGGNQCWSTGNQTAPRDSFVYGPHYAQDKKYRQKYMSSNHELIYNVKFRIRLETQPAQPIEVCSLKIRYRYSLGMGKDTVLVSRSVNSNILSTSEFREITMTYSYPQRFIPAKGTELKFIDGPAQSSTIYDDRIEGTGIEFVVDYLGGARIAVDFIEVYDEQIWKQYIDFPSLVKNQITNYATRSSYLGMQNLNYWHSQDAPLSLDGYEPYRVIDSILDSVNAKPLITDYYPMSDGVINGRESFERWNTLAQPKQLMFWYFPTWLSDSPHPHVNMYNGDKYLLNYLRSRLQEAHKTKPDFYYIPPSMGFWDDSGYYYRRPDSTELRAMVMLALAHGGKGIIFWNYYSYMNVSSPPPNPNPTNYYLRCWGLVDINFNPTPLWHFLKDSLSNRINGNFGKTLLGLKYTGNFLTLRKHIGYANIGSTNNYLELIDPTVSSDTLNFHGGFLYDSLDMNNNKYFLLVNVKTNEVKPIKIKVTNPFNGFINIRFRDIEGSIDTTFSDSCTTPIQYINAGDGKLFQVAPVIKYGGKLIADETISSPTTLREDMTIESGATLYVNSQYTANANIIVKNGGKIVGGSDGQIVFANSKQLIIEGSVQISGTASNHLKLFYEPTTDVGIKVKQGAELNISHCDVMESVVGISTEPNFQSITIEDVNIFDCLGSGIGLIGPVNRHSEAAPEVKN